MKKIEKIDVNYGNSWLDDFVKAHLIEEKIEMLRKKQNEIIEAVNELMKEKK